MNNLTNITNALTIDIEEWYQTIIFLKSKYNNAAFTDLPKSIKNILNLLDKYETKATFFILSSVAEKYPDIIKNIASKGHEIASHGHSHKLVYKMSIKEFMKETQYSLKILEEITQTKILGYRASTWSIPNYTHWSIETLKKIGFKYDSSIYPLTLNPLTKKRKERFIHKTPSGLVEFPPSTFTIKTYCFPFSGGTFLRLFNTNFIKKNITKLNQNRHPAVIYFHSWEFDGNLPIPSIPLTKKICMYTNAKSVRPKIEYLLQNFKFSTIKNILKM